MAQRVSLVIISTQIFAASGSVRFTAPGRLSTKTLRQCSAASQAPSGQNFACKAASQHTVTILASVEKICLTLNHFVYITCLSTERLSCTVQTETRATFKLPTSR